MPQADLEAVVDGRGQTLEGVFCAFDRAFGLAAVARAGLGRFGDGPESLLQRFSVPSRDQARARAATAGGQQGRPDAEHAGQGAPGRVGASGPRARQQAG